MAKKRNKEPHARAGDRRQHAVHTRLLRIIDAEAVERDQRRRRQASSGMEESLPQSVSPGDADDAEQGGKRPQRKLGSAGEILPQTEQNKIGRHMHIGLQSRDELGQGPQ